MKHRSLITLLGMLALAVSLHAQDAWWNPTWTQRHKITLDTGANAAALTESAGPATVLVRLSESNFQFAAARDDGSDLRFVAADGKTLLPHQIESYDNMLNEASIWVRLPEVKAGAKDDFYVYFGNADAAIPAAAKPTDVFDGDTVLDYHFAGRAGAPIDSTTNGNNAETIATTGSSLIGSGLRLLGTAPITIPKSPTLKWKAGQTLTISTWIKPTQLQPNAVILSRADGTSSVRLLLDQGIPTVEVASGGSPQRSTPGTPVAAASWNHLVLVADGKTLKLFLNGTPYASLDGTLPALDTPLTLGGLATESPGTAPFTGELDEFSIATAVRSAAWIKLAAVNPGASEASQRTVLLAKAEGDAAKAQSKFMEHLSLFTDIAGNMKFDGWIAVGVCFVMILVCWMVAIRKFIYLNSIEKGSRIFLEQWKHLSTDLTALDPEDSSSVSSLGGKVSAEDQRYVESSPLFHIYQIGSEEIRHRLDKDNNRVDGLTGRSIQAIRASLDAGLVHEHHRLTDGLIYLTISVAGGPYVGLLGTVVGVMITFAVIARSGEINVNSIAPGIASALLATVVGLIVAIPALFIYSYLNGRIKNSMSLMQVFIDEFVAKMAEFYRPPNEPDQNHGKR